jgi:hypothetical protein
MRRALPLLFLAACGGAEPLDIPADCNPLLAGHDCLLPYPSDFFRDPATGRIETRGAAKLLSTDNLSADLGDWRPIYGFSRLPTIVAVLGTPIARDRLVAITDDPELSTSFSTSASLLIDATTGAAIPHFADLDPFAEDETRRAIVLHPLVSLEEDRRYIVALAGLREPTQSLAPAPEGFRRIRDGETENDPVLGPLTAKYETEIFPLINIPRAEIQLAWDFTTGKDEQATQDMLRVRELTLAALAETPPVVTINAVEEGTKVWRIVRGEVTGPLFLESDEQGEAVPLVYDGDGRVQRNGSLSIPFVAIIPHSAQTSTARAIAYGHGFFGTRREIEEDWAGDIATRLNAVLFAIDWWGMSSQERLGVIANLVGQPSHVLAFTDGVHQGMANWIVMSKAIQNALAREDAFHRPADPNPVYDPTHVYFLGISAGHILGGVAAAVVPDFSRVALNVGGAGWTHIMFRAKPFLPFLEVMSYALADPLARQKYTASMQRGFDRIDPAIYARWALADALPGTVGDRRVLLQIGIGDVEVPNVGAFLHARVLGAGLTMPSPSSVWGVDAFTDQRAALTLFDFGIDAAAVYRDPMPQQRFNEVHLGVRLLEATHAQLDAFFRPDGQVTHPCDGACDPE